MGIGGPGEGHEGGVEGGIDVEVIGEEVVMYGGEVVHSEEGVGGNDGSVEQAAEVGVGESGGIGGGELALAVV